MGSEDEARPGLKPIARRVRALRGTRPTAYARTRYQWLFVYGFGHPADGRGALYPRPAANTDWMGPALSEFARWADPEGRKLPVRLVDGAGWHTAKRLAVPPNVVLHRLPSCTPELQPAEPLWPLVREAVANRGFEDLDAMQTPPIDRCCWLMGNPAVVKGAVGFGWAAALEPS